MRFCKAETRGSRASHLRRREFIALLGVVVSACPFAARGETRSLPIVGYLRRTEPIPVQFFAFRDALTAKGYEDGRNIRIIQRHAAGDPRQLHAHAAELVERKVKIIAVDGLATAQAVLAATKTIPIVFALVTDPSSLGVSRLNRPGGNVTGVLNLIGELQGKRLELLKELIPGLRRVAVVYNSRNPENAAFGVIRRTAAAYGIEMGVFEADEFSIWPQTFDAVATFRPDAVLLVGDATFASRPSVMVALAAARRLPMIYPERHFVTGGGLISYGPDLIAHWRQAAGFVAKILDGAHPGDLPIELPTRLEMVLNLVTARKLGLAVPEALVLRADEVIE